MDTQKFPIWWRDGVSPPQEEEEKARSHLMGRHFVHTAEKPNQPASQPKQPIKQPIRVQLPKKQIPRYNKAIKRELQLKETQRLLELLAIP